MDDQQKQVVHQQLGLLTDLEDQTLQTRFERFCQGAMDVLTSQKADGEPVFDAGSVKASLTIKVSVERTANDTLSFVFDHEVKETLPKTPGRRKSSAFVLGVGLSQMVTHVQLPLLKPAEGQPKPLTKTEAEANLKE